MSMSDRISDWLLRYSQLHRSTAVSSGGSTKRQKTTETTPFPLYFQHAGHSRSIIGFRKTSVEGNKIDSLLLFDPKYSGHSIQDSIAGHGKKKCWQFLSFPLAKIRNEDFQMVCILPGIMTTEEKERSKIIVGLTDDLPIESNI